MGLDLLQFRTYIICPALTSIGLWSESAENLLLGTAMVESNLIYIHQKNGIAVSLMQIEPNTYVYLRKTLMEEYSKTHELMKAALYMDLLPLEPDYLHGNLSAAVMFARLKYYFNPDNERSIKYAFCKAKKYTEKNIHIKWGKFLINVN